MPPNGAPAWAGMLLPRRAMLRLQPDIRPQEWAAHPLMPAARPKCWPTQGRTSTIQERLPVGRELPILSPGIHRVRCRTLPRGILCWLPACRLWLPTGMYQLWIRPELWRRPVPGLRVTFARHAPVCELALCRSLWPWHGGWLRRSWLWRLSGRLQPCRFLRRIVRWRNGIQWRRLLPAILWMPTELRLLPA